MFFFSSSLVLLVASLVKHSSGQSTCENYGEPSGSSCSCPPGFGGSTCSSPACGGNIFQGTNRSIIPDASATSFGNLTLSGCSCQDGWTGTGCNVCKSATSCQSAYTSVNGTSSSSSSSGIDGVDGSSVLNGTLTCNSEPQIYAAGEMSCQVVVRASLHFLPKIYHIFHKFTSDHMFIEPNSPSDLPSRFHPHHPPHTQHLPHTLPRSHLIRLLRLHLRPTLVLRRRTILLRRLFLHTDFSLLLFVR